MHPRLLRAAALTAVILLAACTNGEGASSLDDPAYQPALPYPSDTESPSPTATPTGPRTRIPDGTWKVGAQMEPGTYEAITPRQGCTWARLSGTSGSVKEVLDEGTPAPRVTARITVAPSDKYFQTGGCADWTKVPD